MSRPRQHDRDVTSVVPPWTPPGGLGGAEAVVPPDGDINDPLARAAVFKLRFAQLPTPAEAAALDRLICRQRPALGIVNGKVEKWAFARTFGAAWAPFRRKVLPLLGSVGRIELKGYPVGTGFVVADHLVLTNHHVVDQLGPRGTQLQGAGIRFGLTTSALPPPELDLLVEVAVLHPALDIALLRLDPGRPSPDPLPRATTPPAVAEKVVCIGYPFADYRDPAFANTNFSGNLALETLAPGLITQLNTPIDTVAQHDCQTLGGNSGSPLLSLDTADVVAVHFDGKFLDSNSAILASALHDLVTAL